VSRWWTDLVARIGDTIPLSLAALLLVILAGLISAAAYWWPSWWPWRWWRNPLTGRAARRRLRLRRPRWRRPGLRWRWPWRRRARASEPVAEPASAGGAELPDLPAEAFMSLADRLAAQGRFAEAVRERLRGIVRELVDVGAVDNRPGWTVTELAAAAGAAQPPVHPPLAAATRTFSDIWYGQHPATAVHDGRIRGCAEQIHAVIAGTGAGAAR
jgi:uncharacterized protein DUF4129